MAARKKIRKNNKSSLVTGGCGFVGRHLVKRLLQQGKNIWIIDDLSIGQHPNLWLDKEFKSTNNNNILSYKNSHQQIYFIHGDLIDVLTNELKGDGILPDFADAFHLASIVGGRELIEGDPILVAKDLAIDSIFFLWATRKAKSVERILYASSSTAYPIDLQNRSDYVQLKEEFITFTGQMGIPDMTYGWSKLTGEYLSRLTAAKYGLPIACIRPFSGYGEDQDLTYPVPAIARRVALRENPLTVWGSGKQGRDFVYIEDCIDAFFIILDHISDGSGCNIGSGKILSFLEVLRIFSALEGYTPTISPQLNKPVGVTSRYCDISLISSFNWQPKISYEEGFKRVLNYAKNSLIQELLNYIKSNHDSFKGNKFNGMEKSEFLSNGSYSTNVKVEKIVSENTLPDKTIIQHKS